MHKVHGLAFKEDTSKQVRGRILCGLKQTKKRQIVDVLFGDVKQITCKKCLELMKEKDNERTD